MMFALFAILLAAFILDRAGLQRFAAACLVTSLALCIGLFMWEIYSPEYGFTMPWLQVELKQFFAPARGV
jgi:Na+/H+-dicarboxylate symporter